MTEIRIYHLSVTPLERALQDMLGKILERGMRAVVLCDSAQRVSDLNTKLWTLQQGSFLPHGAASDGFAADQPIWLTDQDGDNPNGATVLVLVGSFMAKSLANYNLCCVFLTADQSALPYYQKQMDEWAAATHPLQHFRQDKTGKWEQGK